jgi:putative membrane protein
MSTPSRLFAACLAVLALAALAAAEPPRPDGPPKGLTDTEFVYKAAWGNTFEVLSSKMAVEKATKAECKALAEKLIADHSKANDALKAVAAKAGLFLPNGMSPHYEKMLADLKAAKDFDAAYLDAQVKAHTEAVALFTAAAAGVKDAGLKEYAAKTLPTLKTHLEHVKKHAGAP